MEWLKQCAVCVDLARFSKQEVQASYRTVASVLLYPSYWAAFCRALMSSSGLPHTNISTSSGRSSCTKTSERNDEYTLLQNDLCNGHLVYSLTQNDTLETLIVQEHPTSLSQLIKTRIAALCGIKSKQNQKSFLHPVSLDFPDFWQLTFLKVYRKRRRASYMFNFWPYRTGLYYTA